MQILAQQHAQGIVDQEESAPAAELSSEQKAAASA
jgi:hypothetical protein